MRFTVLCFCCAALVLSMTGCGKGSTNQRTTTVPKSATEKVQEALAEKQAREEQALAERRASIEAGKLISANTICPVTGYPVDPAIAPIPVELLIVQPPETIMVGVSNAEAAAIVLHDPERYAAAASRNMKARGYTKVGR